MLLVHDLLRVPHPYAALRRLRLPGILEADLLLQPAWPLVQGSTVGEVWPSVVFTHFFSRMETDWFYQLQQ